MIKILNYARLIFGAIAAIAITMCSPIQANGQQVSKLEKFLRKADLNHDGVLEPKDMGPAIKRYMESNGHDSNSRVKISDVINRTPVKKKPAKSKSESSKLKVPKFGVEDSEKTGLPTFSIATEKIDYPQSVIEKADDVLRRYDLDGSKFLEANEISRGNWHSPNPYSHDKNGDGRLSAIELRSRYLNQNTEKQQSKNTNSKLADGKKTERTRSEGGRRFGGGSGRFNRSGRGRQNTSTTEPAKSEPTKSKPSKSSVVKGTGYFSYVTKYIASKDQNGNGVLEGAELDKVKSRSKYDTNKDGKIERQEMLAVLSNDPNDSASSSSSGRSRTSGETSSSFAKIDANNDRLVQMHEFADKWTKKKLDEFLAKDANSDGVISPNEW